MTGRHRLRTASPSNRRARSAASALALSFANVFRTLSILLVTIFLGRSLGPSVVGTFSVLLATVAVLQSVSIGGLSGAAVHKLLTARDEPRQAIEVIVAARLILIPMIYIIGVAVVLVAVGSGDTSAIALVMFFVGYAICTFDVPELIWTSRSKFTHIAVRRLVVVAAIGVPKLIGAASGEYALVIAMQGLEAALWQLCLLRGSGISQRLLRSSIRKLKAGLRQINELKNLWLSSIASALAMRSDIFVVTALLGSAAAGQYSTASRFVEAATILAVAMTTVSFNPLVKSSFDAESYRRQSAAAARTIFVVGFGIAVVLVLIGPRVIELLYGPEFDVAASLIALYSLTTIPIFQRQLISKFLLIERAYGYSLASNLVNLVANVLLNFVLIPLYGIWGAVFAALLSYSISTYIIFLFTQRGRDILILSVGSVASSASRMAPAIHRSLIGRKVVDNVPARSG